MGNGEDGDSCISLFVVKQTLDIERFAFYPGRETHGREYVVEEHSKLQAPVLRVKIIQI